MGMGGAGAPINSRERGNMGRNRGKSEEEGMEAEGKEGGRPGSPCEGET